MVLKQNQFYKQQLVQIYPPFSQLKFSFKNRSNFSVGGAFRSCDNYVVNEQMRCDLFSGVFFQLSNVFQAEETQYYTKNA